MGASPALIERKYGGARAPFRSIICQTRARIADQRKIPRSATNCYRAGGCSWMLGGVFLEIGV